MRRCFSYALRAYHHPAALIHHINLMRCATPYAAGEQNLSSWVASIRNRPALPFVRIANVRQLM
jgi:hypothetical protein